MARKRSVSACECRERVLRGGVKCERVRTA